MKLTFTGDHDAVMQEIVILLNRTGLKVVPFTDAEMGREPRPVTSPPVKTKAKVTQAGRGPGRPRKEPLPEPAEEAPAEAPEEVEVDLPGDDAGVEVEEGEDENVDDKAKAAVDLIRLKEEQLSRLRELFNAGKGLLVRELLAKYGNGAKVFPEVDAAAFPAIKTELDRELGA